MSQLLSKLFAKRLQPAVALPLAEKPLIVESGNSMDFIYVESLERSIREKQQEEDFLIRQNLEKRQVSNQPVKRAKFNLD